MPVVAIGFGRGHIRLVRRLCLMPMRLLQLCMRVRCAIGSKIADVGCRLAMASRVASKICLTVSQEVLDKYPQKSQFWLNDGFGVSLDGSVLYVFGTQPRRLNGVYELLFLNTDITGTSSKFGTVHEAFQPVAVTDWVDKPCYLMRGWQTGTGY